MSSKRKIIPAEPQFPSGTSFTSTNDAGGDENGGTILHLRQTGLRTDPEREVHIQGWEQTLDRLVVVAAGGDPGPDPLAEL